MLISDKQQEANRQNAQHSCGPKTPEGKEAVRLNALTYGLRARSTLIDGEDPEEYKRLWAALEAEWQPHTVTERLTDIGFIGLRRYDAANNRPRLAPQGDETVQ